MQIIVDIIDRDGWSVAIEAKLLFVWRLHKSGSGSARIIRINIQNDLVVQVSLAIPPAYSTHNYDSIITEGTHGGIESGLPTDSIDPNPSPTAKNGFGSQVEEVNRA